MQARDLTPFFEVISLEPNQDLGATLAFKQIKKLMFKHHPDKGGNPEEFKKVNQIKDIFLFIYRDWSEYNDAEKRTFIEFLALTQSEDVVKGILEYKIKKNKCGIQEIKQKLNGIIQRRSEEQRAPYSKLNKIVSNILPDEEKKPSKLESRPQFHGVDKKFNFETDSYENVSNQEREEFIRQLLNVEKKQISAILAFQSKLNINNIPHLCLSLQKRQQQFKEYEMFKYLNAMLIFHLTQIEITAVEVEYQPLVALVKTKMHQEAKFERKDVNYQNIADKKDRDVFIDQLLLLKLSEQKEFLKNQYLKNKASIPHLLSSLISRNNLNKDAALLNEIVALCYADTFIELSKNNIDIARMANNLKALMRSRGHFQMNVVKEKIFTYFELESDKQEIERILNVMQDDGDIAKIKMIKLQAKCLVFSNESKGMQVEVAVRDALVLLAAYKKHLIDDGIVLDLIVTKQTNEDFLCLLKLKNQNLDIEKWSSEDIGKYKLCIVSMLESKLKHSTVDDFKRYYSEHEDDVKVLSQRRFDFSFWSLAKVIGKVMASPIAGAAKICGYSFWNQLWDVSGVEVKESLDRKFRGPK